MNEFYQILLLFAVGSVTGIINVIAGGGSSLSLPVLIFLGLDPSTANGTNRVGILTQSISAVKSFKDENHFELMQSLKISLLTLPGAILGAIAAVKIDDALFQKILGFVLILVALSMVFPKINITDSVSSEKLDWKITIAMLFVGFYGGFIQVGVGFVIMAALHYLMKLTLVKVNMHKVFVTLVFTIPALIIFIVASKINWFLGLSLATGNAFGGWWAAKLTVIKGDKLIKFVLVLVVIFMALKLLNLF
ncbi:MAG: sulfite exporter TauE/SafE family protein [Melioribacteraceae bacterium]|nr:sulfite exporter TauE/SafE family protein [Melioribacteraceae bacterium]